MEVQDEFLRTNASRATLTTRCAKVRETQTKMEKKMDSNLVCNPAAPSDTKSGPTIAKLCTVTGCVRIQDGPPFDSLCSMHRQQQLKVTVTVPRKTHSLFAKSCSICGNLALSKKGTPTSNGLCAACMGAKMREVRAKKKAGFVIYKKAEPSTVPIKEGEPYQFDVPLEKQVVYLPDTESKEIIEDAHKDAVKDAYLEGFRAGTSEADDFLNHHRKEKSWRTVVRNIVIYALEQIAISMR